MSGEKRTYVSVEDQELRRLREQESRLRTLNQDLPERLEEVRQQAEREMRNRLAPIEKRQREYESTVNNLQSELGDLERETQQRLVRQQKEFTGRLDSQRGEYTGLIREQGERLTTAINTERQERQLDVKRLNNQLEAIANDASRKKDIARSFIVDLDTVVREVDRLPHRRFSPGGMDAVNRRVNDARHNLQANMAEAALSTAQDAYWEVADLRIIVIEKEKEFMIIHEAALSEARALLAEARANRRLQVEGDDQNKAFEAEVDHWTRGELKAHESLVDGKIHQLENGVETLTTDEARAILAELDELKPRIFEIVDHARQNILASQLRVEIAERAASALAAQLFDVVDATYEGDDERNSFVVKVRNRAGTEVVTVIAPVEGEYGKNEVSIHSFDQTYVDDSVRQQRAQELVTAINGDGFQAATPACMGNADSRYQDLEKVRQRQETPARNMTSR